MALVRSQFYTTRAQDDPVKFVEDGGWDFLDLEKSDDEDEESEESEGARFARAVERFCASLC